MEGDNPSGKPPVTPLPDALQRTLERTPYRYMGGYNTWYVCVLEDDWDRIVAHLVAVPADARGEHKGNLETVAGKLAAMMLRESVEAGNTIEIPSLGITITKDDLDAPPAGREGGEAP